MKPSVNGKVGAGAIAGALSVILVWGITQLTGAAVPPEIASAFTTVLTFAVSWFVPDMIFGGGGFEPPRFDNSNGAHTFSDVTRPAQPVLN